MKIKLIQSVCMIMFGLMMATALSGFVVSAEESSFSMDVITRPNAAETSSPIVYRAIPGQDCIFLITVFDMVGVDSVEITAIADGGNSASPTVYPDIITADDVAEVTITPKQSNVGETLTLTISGNAAGVTVTETVYIQVNDGFNGLTGMASDVRNSFIPWIAENYPELEIDQQTVWNPTIVHPGILVVMHYMFLSEDWEMYVTWHVMIEPYDWARVYLRPRYVETAPIYAFEDSSRADPAGPIVIDVPTWV